MADKEISMNSGAKNSDAHLNSKENLNSQENLKENSTSDSPNIASKKENIFLKFYHSWTGTVILVLIVVCCLVQSFNIPSGSMKNTLLIGDFLFVKKFSYGVPTPHLPWLEWQLLPDFDNDGHLISGEGPKRGDIVVFRNPLNFKEHYVKRMVAKGGDEVLIAQRTLFVRMAEGDAYMSEHYADKLMRIDGRLFVREPYDFKGIHNDASKNIEALYQIYLQHGEFAMKPVFLKEFGPLSINGANAYICEVPENEYFMMGDNRDNSNDSRFWGSVPYKLIVGKPWLVYFSLDEKRNIRWERIGRFVDTLESDERFIHNDASEDEIPQFNRVQ